MTDDRRSDISRRDFLNGLAVGIGALGSLSSADLLRAGILQTAEDYPPARTGLRGSHDGAFEVAHRLRDGVKLDAFGVPQAIDTRYDLIVVGAGISGLSAAHYFRKQAGPNARILILDNHDDFGGHARRNEFTVDGKTLIGYAGTQSIDTPGRYSSVSKQLLKELAIDVQKFYKYYDRGFFRRQQLATGTFYDKETFGADVLVAQPGAMSWQSFYARSPLSPAIRRSLVRLNTESKDYLAGRTPAEKLQLLAKTSYKAWLLDHVKLPAEAIPVLQTATHDYFGVGIDAVPAGDCRGLGFPGFAGLGLGHAAGPGQGLTSRLEHDEPYIFHFPDGNATIARLLVRKLIPGVLSGTSMEDVVTARARYGALDQARNAVRLRLGATAVNVRHTKASTGDVEVTYVKGGKAWKATAGACVLACWHGIVPHICPELPQPQKDALKYGVKVPLLYTNVALRRWTSLAREKVHTIRSPGMYWSSTSIDFPVSMGTYRFARGPEEPVLLHMLRTPCKPGFSARDQQRLGRAELLGTSYVTLEHQVRDQLTRMLGPAGFDADRDIAGITVNRWSHGYAYEYNSLYDPVWAPGEAPNEIARARRGNIVIANSDAAAYAYTNAAIDEAWRAVSELGSRRTA